MLVGQRCPTDWSSAAPSIWWMPWNPAQVPVIVTRRREQSMFERSTIHPPTRFHVAGARRAIGAAVGLTLAMGISAIPSYADNLTPNGSSVGSEPYRPGLHYTPAKNWMNDPNGMVYFNGTYHLFYQYNPQGPDWGNMSWGHATSTDLMNWTEVF